MAMPIRGGSRGGKDQFDWDDVKIDKDRESYLGHSVKASVGRWQKGKDLSWYTKKSKFVGESDNLKAEIAAIKRAEDDAMAAALGLKPSAPVNPQQVLSKKEIAEACRRRSTEDAEEFEEERMKGIGYQFGGSSQIKSQLTFVGSDSVQQGSLVEGKPRVPPPSATEKNVQQQHQGPSVELQSKQPVKKDSKYAKLALLVEAAKKKKHKDKKKKSKKQTLKQKRKKERQRRASYSESSDSESEEESWTERKDLCKHRRVHHQKKRHSKRGSHDSNSVSSESEPEGVWTEKENKTSREPSHHQRSKRRRDDSESDSEDSEIGEKTQRNQDHRRKADRIDDFKRSRHLDRTRDGSPGRKTKSHPKKNRMYHDHSQPSSESPPPIRRRGHDPHDDSRQEDIRIEQKNKSTLPKSYSEDKHVHRSGHWPRQHQSKRGQDSEESDQGRRGGAPNRMQRGKERYSEYQSRYGSEHHRPARKE